MSDRDQAVYRHPPETLPVLDRDVLTNRRQVLPYGLCRSTPGAAAVHVRQPEAPSPSAVGAGVAEPDLLKAVPLLATRLGERHPAASRAMVQRSIEDAIRAFSNVRVRLYLPILIERAASEALREASRSREGAAPTCPPSNGLDL